MSKIISATFFLIGILCLQTHVFAQSEYKMAKTESIVKIKPTNYYLKSVIDRRKDRNNNGKIISSNGKLSNVVFSSALDSTILIYSNEVLTPDTTKIPVSIIIEKFNYSDVGSLSKHTLSLDVKLSVIRNIEGQEFVLFGTNGTPSFIAQRFTSGLAEKLFAQITDALLTGFDDYSKTNSEQQSFCKYTTATFIYDNSYTNYKYDDTIRWDSGYKLKWDDFQGKPDPSSPFSAQSNCMFSFKSKIDYVDGIQKLSLMLYSCFTKKASWVIEKNQRESLLKHEQLHFDICELHIRKLKKKISELQLTLLNPGDQIKTEFELAWSNYQVDQALYDEETQHGIIENMQKIWEEKVGKSLNDLEEFSTRLAEADSK